MYPDSFNGYGLEQLAEWRTKILADLQQAQEQAIDAGINPDYLGALVSMGVALGKVESEMHNRPGKQNRQSNF